MSSPTPALAVSNALIFADPAVNELLGLQEVSTTWRNAIVLARPFWDERNGKLSQPIDVAGEISPLVAASIAFDPDREVKINDVALTDLSDGFKASLALVRRVRLLDTSLEDDSMSKLLELMPNLTALTLQDVGQLKASVSVLSSLDHLDELRVHHFMGETTVSLLEPLATSLRKLHLCACNCVDDISSLAKFVKLEAIRMTGCGALEDTSVLETLPSLRSKDIICEMDPWEYDAYTKPEVVPVQLLGTFANFLRSDNPEENLQGTLMIRKLLFIEDGRPYDEVIEEGCVDLLVSQLLRDEMPPLQCESAWALSNLASGSMDYIHLVLSTEDALPNFVRLLGSPDEDCRDQAAWVIGNLSADGGRCRDFCLEGGVLEPLLAHFATAGQKQVTARNAAWAVSNLCRNKPLMPKHEMIAPALPVIVGMLNHDDDEIIASGALAISYLTGGRKECVQRILDTGCLPRMIELLSSTTSEIIEPAIRTIGNVVVGNDLQKQAVFSSGVLPLFLKLLDHDQESIRKEVCWTVSNITAESEGQIQIVIDANLFPAVMKATKGFTFDLKKEATWVIANATTFGSPHQIDHLVQNGVLQCLCELLGVYNPKIVGVALEALENILDYGDRSKSEKMLDSNPYADLISEFGGCEVIEGLQNHSNADILGHAEAILETYFGEQE